MTPAQPTPKHGDRTTDGNLLLLVTASLYALFTLLPNSSTQMVTWPWVAVWQVTLLFPVLWLIWQLWHKPLHHFRLGNGFDWLAGAAVLGLTLSTLAADFPQQARWYAWAALSGLAALYALTGWLTPNRAGALLQAQAYLALVFIVWSLGLWLLNTYLPELSRLAALREYGIEQTFNFEILSLRNGFPLGHQNYVAGYLVLVLPLFVGLAVSDKTRQRWLWVGAIALGLLTLYTTSSRGGALALVALIVPAIFGLVQSCWLPRRIALPGAAIALVGLGLLAIANPRVRTTLAALRSGGAAGGQLAYRIITNTVGWNMGQQRPWAGLGPGSVPLVFQRYRPFWAGREAELHHQLHSTPAQLWAELGIWGIALPVAAAVLLGIGWWRRRQQLSSAALPAALLWSLVGGLWAYSVLSLTDYQLDLIPISSVIVIYLAVILLALRQSASEAWLPADHPRRRRWLVGAALGLVAAVSLWLVPIHRAWLGSAQGFRLLQQDHLEGFVARLQQAQRLVPWEAYYPWQSGWVLGNLSYFQTEDPADAAPIRAEAIAHFRAANTVSPYQEFGHANLAWLETREDPAVAVQEFGRAAQLLPAKEGVFFGLGYSLLLANQPERAIDAMVLEAIRHPLVLTSQVWSIGQFAEIYPRVLTGVDALCSEFLETAEDFAFTQLLHQIRGTVRWWANDLATAADIWETNGTPISQAVLAMAREESPNLETLPEVPGKYALQAWFEPDNRQQLLETAWLMAPHTLVAMPPTEPIERLVSTMNAATTFDQWLKETAPSIEVRNERLGFGILSRHDDGITPSDYYVKIVNLPMAQFFADMVPSPTYLPIFDQQLQPYREALVTALVEE